MAKAKPKRKNPAAVALGRLGGKVGGKIGGKKVWADVPPEERSRRMRAAVEKRWAKARQAKTAKPAPKKR